MANKIIRVLATTATIMIVGFGIRIKREISVPVSPF